jgi:hypothetical protein
MMIVIVMMVRGDYEDDDVDDDDNNYYNIYSVHFSHKNRQHFIPYKHGLFSE